MDASLPSVLTGATILGTAVNGGFYLAFSGVVMPALRRLTAAHAVEAMQHINVRAVRGPFMLTFFGGAAAATGLAVHALSRLGQPGAASELVGAGLSLAGFAATVLVNVPLNARMARLDPAAAGAGTAWAGLERRWMGANHLRCALSVASAVVLLAGAGRA
jgi:uncharacterized membrane protein